VHPTPLQRPCLFSVTCPCLAQQTHHVLGDSEPVQWQICCVFLKSPDSTASYPQVLWVALWTQLPCVSVYLHLKPIFGAFLSPAATKGKVRETLLKAPYCPLPADSLSHPIPYPLASIL
jgi:hypothetical protein